MLNYLPHDIKILESIKIMKVDNRKPDNSFSRASSSGYGHVFF